MHIEPQRAGGAATPADRRAVHISAMQPPLNGLNLRDSLTAMQGLPYRKVMNTVTRAHLAERIYTQVGLSRNESADLLEHVLERVCTALQEGESVKISGFGTFSVRQKGRRVGRNPKTGVEVPILPRRVLVFRPSQVLKAHINGQAAPEGDDE
jgi:integration host factor subunit alpha